MTQSRIVLLDEDRASARRTHQVLEPLGKVVCVERWQDFTNTQAEHGADVIVISARKLGEAGALRIARRAHEQFGLACVIQTASAISARRAQTTQAARIHWAKNPTELRSAVQLALSQRDLQREQQRANEQTVRADAAESAARSGIKAVHELNNLLSAIRCNAFLIQTGPLHADAVREAAKDITTAVERGAELTTKVSALLRASGHSLIESEPPPSEPGYTEPRLGGLSQRPLQASDTGLKRILVVDDDPVVHRSLSRFLTSRGYSVFPARTPREAIYLAEHEQVEVVITDVLMPDMTGYELAQRIKKLRPDVRFIYMSGYAPGGARGRPVPKAVQPLLQKPFAVETLMRLLSATTEDGLHASGEL